MPIHRGIEISIVSQVELMTHPEFPHPESSQFTYRSPDLRKGPKADVDWTPPSASSDSKADRFLGRRSVVSVYIPSMPGKRFWLKYNVVEAAEIHSEWFYFKLHMNGRHITSWGTNTKSRPSGQVMRGLFEPSDRWNYKHEGTVFRNMGTEARPFMFAFEDDEERSAANDGGLIEVMVFRARGRKRRLPKPTDFKDQEGYGIVMPSGGLLEKPQDAKFYDWHLKDPKDTPFATFKFHYRSWDSLASLQLIPENHPRTLAPLSPTASHGGDSQDQLTELDEEPEEECDKEVRLKRELSSTFFGDPWLTSVFDDSPERPSNGLNKRPSFKVPPETSLFSRSNTGSPESPFSKFSTAIIDKSTSPKESPLWMDRPLPEVPPRDSSLSLRRHPRKYSIASGGHSRSSSGVSNALSIAPSLLQELDRESQSPEVLLGIAEIVDVYSSPNPHFESPVPSISEFPSVPGDLSENTPRTALSVSTSRRCGISSPPSDTLFSMANITIRKTRRSPAKRLSEQQPQSPNSPQDSPCPTPSRSPTENFGNLYEDADQSPLEKNTTTITLSESEWMAHTPSPVRKIPRFGSLQNMWSPGLANRKSRNMGTFVEKVTANENFRARRGGSGSIPKKDGDWYENVNSSDEKLPATDQSLSDSGSRDANPMMEGNWI
ncbi:uncharacterized protein L3040_000894 [Drepanopeziza brunnea f. sp. 'multigermtubi']|uniref:Uncharacterized protein n=1 Tax=Marssonina brunnea f. sp. multigermtubi (strain MB_m1) TaxID=1072389 RepID=K1XKA9_MARBU|nr:uncharacterized protein MBM_00181 [Drepanopeziza brunnea f. sp. 'multigermtubi' MB_m1]EKD21068.1 hypothetical protein MBM_00181 [Drepanopeziza brunnea f. sp. 'multigermtubi' MB_m1]KAJ5054627.1 hypothetical protein L3040_000894 [Drepanopeziza brunnea f. sp. 'multigermtubi']